MPTAAAEVLKRAAQAMMVKVAKDFILRVVLVGSLELLE